MVVVIDHVDWTPEFSIGEVTINGNAAEVTLFGIPVFQATLLIKPPSHNHQQTVQSKTRPAPVIETTLGEVLSDIDLFPLRNWVFVRDAKCVSSASSCLVVDTTDAETGSDGFTPFEAEKRQMAEFLSIQDLKDVIEVLELSNRDATMELKCSAAAYYFENDAFMPSSNSA